MKLPKGKWKGSHNYPYFTERGDCDREAVQLSSLMSCGKRQKKNPDLRKNPSIPHRFDHYFAFKTFWLRIFKKYCLGFLAGELVTTDVQATFVYGLCLCSVSLPLRESSTSQGRWGQNEPTPREAETEIPVGFIELNLSTKKLLAIHVFFQWVEQVSLQSQIWNGQKIQRQSIIRWTLLYCLGNMQMLFKLCQPEAG